MPPRWPASPASSAARPKRRVSTRCSPKVRAAFQREWLRADGELTVDTQTAYLLALAFDLIPSRDRAHAADRLVKNIAQLDWHLSTGFIGVSLLNPILTLTGHADVAYKLLLREDYPSWLYPVNTAPRRSGNAGTVGPRKTASSTRT